MTLEKDEKQERIAGLIYAGGRGARMGGVDKAMIMRDGAPLIAHMSRALAPFVSDIFVTRQKDQADLSEFGQVIYDDTPDQGPLAGLVAGLKAAEDYDFLLTAAVDGDGLPADYFSTLKAHAKPHAMAAEGEQIHPTYALISVPHAADIFRSYANGGRALRAWVNDVNCNYAQFATGSFRNLNHGE